LTVASHRLSIKAVGFNSSCSLSPVDTSDSGLHTGVVSAVFCSLEESFKSCTEDNLIGFMVELGNGSYFRTSSSADEVREPTGAYGFDVF